MECVSSVPAGSRADSMCIASNAVIVVMLPVPVSAMFYYGTVFEAFQSKSTHKVMGNS